MSAALFNPSQNSSTPPLYPKFYGDIFDNHRVHIKIDRSNLTIRFKEANYSKEGWLQIRLKTGKSVRQLSISSDDLKVALGSIHALFTATTQKFEDALSHSGFLSKHTKLCVALCDLLGNISLAHMAYKVFKKTLEETKESLVLNQNLAHVQTLDLDDKSQMHIFLMANDEQNVHGYTFTQDSLLGTGSSKSAYKSISLPSGELKALYLPSPKNHEIALYEKTSRALQREMASAAIIRKRVHNIVAPSLFKLVANVIPLGIGLLCDGTLANLIKLKKPLNLVHICQLIAIVADLHKIGILHLDLKPSNIYVKNGNIYLGDLEFCSQEMEQTPFKGTLTYMAPECFPYIEELAEDNQMKSAKSSWIPTQKIDIWALGCTLHQMIYSKHPFTKQAYEDISKGNLLKFNSEYTHLMDFLSEEPVGPLQNILIQSLQLKPDDRASAEGLQGMLKLHQ